MNQPDSAERRKSLLWLAFWIGVSLTAQASASAFTGVSVGTWYQTLDKPAWEPPGWAFPVAWTYLYISMGFAAWLVWSSDKEGRGGALALHGLQLFLNVGWTFVFFYLRSLAGAALEIVALWLAILAACLAFRRHSRAAALLMVPYLAWVAFATALTFSIWRRNG